MEKVTRIHKDKPSKRTHYIVDWAEKRDFTQAEIARKLNVDKGTVSRWFKKGTVPREDYMEHLAALFHLDGKLSLFRHPDDDWMAKMFRGRSEEEKERMKQAMELMFPRKSG